MNTAIILDAAIALIDLGGKLYEVVSRAGELTPEQAAAFRKRLEEQKAKFDNIKPFTGGS